MLFRSGGGLLLLDESRADWILDILRSEGEMSWWTRVVGPWKVVRIDCSEMGRGENLMQIFDPARVCLCNLHPIHYCLCLAVDF